MAARQIALEKLFRLRWRFLLCHSQTPPRGLLATASNANLGDCGFAREKSGKRSGNPNEPDYQLAWLEGSQLSLPLDTELGLQLLNTYRGLLRPY